MWSPIWSSITATRSTRYPSTPKEVPDCTADLGAVAFLVFLCMGFGGRSIPNIYGRFASMLCRFTQAMFSSNIARLQQFVDDPIMSVAGPPSEAAEVFDIAILFWLTLGASLPWEKGTVTT